ncbi:ABC transporter permease [Salinisphaera sp. LB1]|uniref:MlaE family ABC transporter permease n=1 Tax=Salinisphaera sp. LB1 TaxID=2183911 RepID=UPI000D7053DF|nr:ABC transporter permease [Salinisphaera sp. LB1]AWN14572.1 ABC-type transport system involved in resistance to organic solvents, permease component [Salinisphaera sp. LB1]
MSGSTALYSLDSGSGESVLRLAGDWGEAARLPAAAEVQRDIGHPDRVVIDGSRLASGHPRVAAFVHALKQALVEADVAVTARALPRDVEALMALASEPPPKTPGGHGRPHPLARLGARFQRRLEIGRDTAALVGQALARTPALATGRAQTRWRDFIELVQETGAASLPVVTVVNLLIGAVLGFIGAVQLATFGAGMYLADLVGIASAREMAAIMTAFIMAGRIGATFAAHLATMESNEEVDALRMIGVSPFEFLALPRLAALTLMMPLLYLYGTALSIVGGMVVAHIVLGTPPMAFIERLQDAVAARQFVIGLIKSVAFGVLIALTSCYIGLHAGRNAAEVGRAATRTVVVCIIGVISIDAVAALCTNALGI